MPEPLSIRGYARRRGCSHVAVLKAIETGRLAQAVVEDAKGRRRIDPEVADREWAANTDQAQQREHHRGPDQGELFDTGAPEPVRKGGNGKGPSLTDSRAVREVYAARLLQLEYSQRCGDLVERVAVDLEFYRMAKAVREAFERMPERMAAILAAEPKQTEVHRLLEKEVREALELLARDAGS